MDQKEIELEDSPSRQRAMEVAKKAAQGLAASSFYMFVSIGQVFVLRMVMTDKAERAGSWFTSWFQFVIAFLLIVIIRICFRSVPVLNRFPPLSELKANVMLKVMPVSIIFLLMIGLNNLTLKHVSVSAYLIVRSLTVLWSILISLILFKEKTTWQACLACSGVVVGFAMGVEGEVHLTWVGVACGVASSIFVASYAIAVKRALNIVEKNDELLIEYNTINAMFLMIPFVMVSGEYAPFLDGRTWQYWAKQVFGGVLGFVLNIATFLSINYTSPLTHNLSGTLKACIQTILALVIFPGTETMGWAKGVGTALVISCSCAYGLIRRREMMSRARKGDEAILVEDAGLEDTSKPPSDVESESESPQV